MKRKISSLVIASAILTGTAFTPIALNEVSAASVQQQKVNVKKETVVVNGGEKTVLSTEVNKMKLYSIKELANLMSANVVYNKKTKKYEATKKIGNQVKKVEYAVNSTNAIINGKKLVISVAPRIIDNKLYVDAESLVTALGGDIVVTKNGYFISTDGLVSGNTFNPQWVNNSTILVTNETEVDSRSLLINTASKKADFTINATELVVSPNGKQAIYSDENGFVFLVDLLVKKVKSLNVTDDSVKLDFVWSKDGQVVYFIKGEKSDEVASINLSTGVIKEIFKDKLIYKTDLRLSVDGNKLLYTVGQEGKTTTTEGDNPEVVSIDLTGTEDQFYVINLEDEKPAGVVLTTSTDNKVSPAFLPNGNVVYISADADSDKLPELKVISGNGKDVKVSTLVKNKDIVSFKVTAEGKIMLLAKVNGYSDIYEVNPVTKALTKVASTKLVLTSFDISNGGKSIVATTLGKNGDVVVVYKNGVFEALTK